ncbi:methylmalonyl Co-A mutase-associated GTPase MeaB [Nakamurella panacisegetis]|uniref:methylmalonyl Co-A mutase-associated GTPase MeaB n=1 Tax=Nakamurella panacisegetis TaxID=1090615 RepID=UPI0038B297AB
MAALVIGRHGDGPARAALSRSITLMESTRPDHRVAARELYALLAPHAGGAVRVGISGAPGVGKSTLIEALGTHLTAAGHRVGVLAVDPSSTRTGGSVLGDKTRMPRLSADPNAYIRPSPNAGTLGGVARSTAQAITVLEAAGFDVVIVETVGVGQSETTVASMVDTFLLLALSRTGDQLQGIKKGVVELADVIAVNKADGERLVEAEATARDLAGAVRLVRGKDARMSVLTCSGLTGAGIEELWAAVMAHRTGLTVAGLARKRAGQQVELTWTLVRDELDQRLRNSPHIAAIRDRITQDVAAGRVSSAAAADQLLAAYDSD